MIVIDTINADEHSRLTLTKKVKKVFPVLAGDTIVVYQDKYDTNELIFKIQRKNNIVDTWSVKRKDVGIKANANSFMSNNGSKKSSYDLADVMQYDNTIYQRKLDTSPANIILVEDEKDVLCPFEMVLCDQGYNVKSFAESREAIKHVIELSRSSSYYDLAILDIRMPHINGIQLYQILKILNKDIKVLFVSALDAAEEITGIFPEIESSNIMRKPFSKDLFIQKVQEIINQ
ncbi:MAG TPA: response regulator [Nitrososphaeraceae archaeon]|nr:response regulator [Nitrososphaeraceae archaeon]